MSLYQLCWYCICILQHTDSPSSHLLVSFVGDSGDLASAVVGRNMIDIWGPPPTDSTSEVVMQPNSDITLDISENIIRYNCYKIILMACACIELHVLLV